MIRSLHLVFIFQIFASASFFVSKDPLTPPTGVPAINPSTMQYRRPFEEVSLWLVRNNQSVLVDATSLPSAGDSIESDLSSEKCGDGQYMISVSTNATMTFSYGLVNISSTKVCRGVFRVEQGAVFRCDELIIGPDVIFLLFGRVVCRHFVLSSGAMLQGTGSVESSTARVDGDVIPGFMFLERLFSDTRVVQCFSCAASLLDSEGQSYDRLPAYGNQLSLLSTTLLQLRGSIWISYNILNVAVTNKVIFGTVQFLSPARVVIVQPRSSSPPQGTLQCISADTVVTPSSISTFLNFQNSTTQNYQISSPFVEFCRTNVNLFSPCHFTSLNQLCQPDCPVQEYTPPPLCATYSGGTLGVLIGSTSPPSGCSDSLNLVSALGSTNTSNTSSTMPPVSSDDRTTVIILATVIPGAFLVIAGTVLAVLLYKKHEESKARAQVAINMSSRI